MIKFIIFLYFLVIAALILMIPVKLLTSVQSSCPSCGRKVFYSRRKKEFHCPQCGTEIIKQVL